ncbi:molybdopterin guanine dinucleotide-containing S/N-oxide reductase [Pikeienuella sp. HZG-20]|uniref:molybdopterin guanine dinucleotide-containing S/N-oxide reductase n=1 Tax=Paludibacillus litoralis TaxID=3133267 RepID=UPI0030ECB631
MTHYTSTHWGIREVTPGPDGKPRLTPFSGDPDPNMIGLDQGEDGLQALRVRRPAIRRSWLEQGPGAAPELRGREPFVEVEWDEALDLAAAEIDRVRRTHGNEAIFGGSYGWSSAGRFHHAQSQVHRFLNAAGGYVRHLHNYSYAAARVILPHVIAEMSEFMVSHTSWDVMAKHTTLFVGFGGAPWKSGQISAGGVARHRMRPGLKAIRDAGARMVTIGPVGDNLEAEGVEWIPARPNTDTAVMLALAYTLLQENLHDTAFLERYCTGFDTFARYLTGADGSGAKTPEWAEAISAVPAATIAALARDMAANRTMINMTWALQRASHGEQACWMQVTLAAMLGQIGLPGGGFAFGYGATNQLGSNDALLPGPTLPQGFNAVKTAIPVARISDMLLNPGGEYDFDGARHTYPDIHLIYWAGGNPWHHHQDLNRFARAWRKPDTIIINEQYWTAAAKRADIVFPATIALERDDIGSGTREGHLVAMKQAAPPIGEARDDYAIFSALAARLGVEETFTEGLDAAGWLRRLYEESRPKMQACGVTLPEFDDFWAEGMIDLAAEAAPVVMFEAFRADPDAAPLITPSGKIEIFSEVIDGFGLDDCPGHPTWLEPHEWLGSADAAADGEGAGALHLISDQPARKLHSQLDASAHSRAAKVDGREVMDINPADAAERGIADNDVVELYNARGRCLAAARLNPLIMRGVVRLPTGSWYDPDPDGRDKHGNPNVLTLDVGTSRLGQGPIAHTCLVRVRGPINSAPPVTAFDPPEFSTARGPKKVSTG